MDWLKIVSAIFIAAMMFMMFPRLKHAMQNSPKGTGQDWWSAIKPLIFVVLFVIVLIALVR